MMKHTDPRADRLCMLVECIGIECIQHHSVKGEGSVLTL
jgi:hypothetical protein